MILILIGALIGVIYNIYALYTDWMRNPIIDYVMFSIFGALLGGILGFCASCALPMDTYIKKYSWKIETLQDNDSVSGSFFLGCGQVNGKMKYVLYTEENDLFKMMQLDYMEVKIKYSDSNPKVNVSEICPTESWVNLFAFDCNVFDKTYVIEVPKGTIKNNYTLDAQ